MAATTARATSTRQQLLDASVEEFASFGYRRTSMDAIARRAGLSRATVYLHWASKEALFRDLVTDLHAERTSAMEAALVTPGDVEVRLTALLLARYDRFVQLTAASPAAAELYNDHDRLCGDISLAADIRARELLTSFVRGAIRRREIDLARAGLTVDALVDILLSLGHAAKGERPSQSTPTMFQEALTAMVRLCMRGIARQDR